VNQQSNAGHALLPAQRFLMARLRTAGIAIDVMVNDDTQATVVQQSEKLTAFDANALQDAFRTVCFE